MRWDRCSTIAFASQPLRSVVFYPTQNKLINITTRSRERERERERGKKQDEAAQPTTATILNNLHNTAGTDLLKLEPNTVAMATAIPCTSIHGPEHNTPPAQRSLVRLAER
ncbi:hypothetical protein D8674_010467 [Pyrus ussuriensis x Pyrus communis]|uniref:Uncharacterized protein n=1 Tax=Pyrus ussuriensis x Pyrus communis TaxID=2448454 RepID=A0A5N5FAT8_9ROSA|nr:hypothetical protein D8674_010467 [Pyrus ussuriensis x Pyrus communis]